MPIVVLSARSSPGDRVLGLTEGADDYLPKPFSPAELVAHIWSILRRTERHGLRFEPGLRFRSGDLEVEPERHAVTVGGRTVTLSALELRLLTALLAADGRTVTRNRLLDAIHGEGEADVTNRSVDVYVKRIREKLSDHPDRPPHA